MAFKRESRRRFAFMKSGPTAEPKSSPLDTSMFRKDWWSTRNHRLAAQACAPVSRPLHSSRAISNHRLVSLRWPSCFRWRDSAHNNEQKFSALSVDDSCRFLLHLLPQGFVRIRNFGFLATATHHTPALCFHLLGATRSPAPTDAASTMTPPMLWRCPSVMAQ